MKKIKQRALAWLLTLCMVLTMTPSVAFAAPDGVPAADESVKAESDGGEAAPEAEDTADAEDEVQPTSTEEVGAAPIANGIPGNAKSGIMQIDGGDVAEVVGDKAYPTLEAAIAAITDNSGKTVKLLDDAEVSEVIAITNKTLTIDLAGRTITNSGSDAVFNVGDKSGTTPGHLTITNSTAENGEITSSAAFPTIRVNAGSILTVEKGAISNTSSDSTTGAIQVSGADAKTTTVTIEDGTITGEKYGIAVFGKATLNVEGGTITGKKLYGIATNGSVANTGSIVRVSGGIITGGNAGMYLPSQEGETTVTGNAQITGTNGAGIVVRGGTIEVSADEDGIAPTITAGGSGQQTYGDNGNRLPASALVVEKNDSYGDIASAKISDGTFKATEENNSVSYVENGTKPSESAEPGIEIAGGTFKKDNGVDTSIKEYIDPSAEINAVTGEVAPRAEDAEDAFWQVDGKNYASLEDAIKAAGGENPIKLLKDVELPGNGAGENRIEVNKKIKIDLNGKTLSKSDELTDDKFAGLRVGTGGDLTITDSLHTGKITGQGTLLGVFGGSLTLDGCVVDQTAGDDKNNCAVDTGVEGGTITVKEGTTIKALESGLGASQNGVVKVEGGTITAGIYGIATNGSDTSKNATVTITGGKITGNKAGMYLPSQGGKTTISGDATIEGTDGAGIVVRGGEITIEANEKGESPTIKAGGTDKQIYGDNKTDQLPPAALVLDKKEYGGETKKATISDGKFEVSDDAETDVVVLMDGTNKAEDNLGETLNVKGGYFSKEVDESYLDKTLNEKMVSEKTPETYSYYSSVADAKAVDPEGDVTPLTSAQNKASIVAMGFKADGEEANKAINASYAEVYNDSGTWANGGVSNSIQNTFYATFKTGTEVLREEAHYYIKFTNSSKSDQEYKDMITIPVQKKGAVIYASFDDQASALKDGGTIKAELYKVDTATDTGGDLQSQASIEVYQAEFNAGNGKFTGNGKTVDAGFVMKGDLVSVANPSENPTRDDGYTFGGWNRSAANWDSSTYKVTIDAIWNPPYTPPAPSTPSNTVNKTNPVNGKFTISNQNAKAGDTVTVTPDAEEGYVVDQVTVTDRNGQSVIVTKNEDGTYSFTMPAEELLPVEVKVTFKEDAGGEVTPPTEDPLVFSSASQEKAIKNRITTNEDTSLKLKAATEGVTIGSLKDWDVTSDNEAVVRVLKPSNKLRYMGVGTANITVKATGSDGKVYSIVIPINVKLGTPTFTLSHVSSKKARTFTVTTSTVRGADGFQVKYSLKKSLKSSKTKTYECGKKLNRRTIKANKSKRTYYVRVRAYIIDEDGNVKTGAWSKLTKTIKSK